MATDDTTQIRRDQTQELPRTIAVKQTRKVALAILGGGLILLGIALVPLPGPFTIPLILAGLTVLSWEFRWAKRMLFTMRRRFAEIRARRKARSAARAKP